MIGPLNQTTREFLISQMNNLETERTLRTNETWSKEHQLSTILLLIKVGQQIDQTNWLILIYYFWWCNKKHFLILSSSEMFCIFGFIGECTKTDVYIGLFFLFAKSLNWRVLSSSIVCWSDTLLICWFINGLRETTVWEKLNCFPKNILQS